MKLRAKRPTVELTDTVLTESVSTSQIDRESGVIKHVKVLGIKSHNGREYSQQAREQARTLYEGCEVNVDHLDRDNLRKERGIGDGWGVLKNSILESDGNYADLHFLKSHPGTELFLERVDRGFPIGLSHHANGKLGRHDGRVMVESISNVRSVDLVRRPATSTNLFESIEEPMKTTKTTIREAIEATGYKHTSALLEMLPEEANAEAVVEVPEGEGETEVDATEGVVKALASEAAKIIADPAIDSAATIAKVKGIIKTVENVKKDLGPDTEAPAAEAPAKEGEEEEKPVVESITKAIATALTPLQESVAGLQMSQRRDALVSEYQIDTTKITESQRSALNGAKTEKGVRDLLESLPPAAKFTSDFRTSILQESQADGKPTKHIPLARLRR